jgi:hypothetical protein
LPNIDQGKLGRSIDKNKTAQELVTIETRL